MQFTKREINNPVKLLSVHWQLHNSSPELLGESGYKMGQTFELGIYTWDSFWIDGIWKLILVGFSCEHLTGFNLGFN